MIEITEEIKLAAALIASVISIFNVLYYTRETINERIKPHAYTWLIWSLTGLISFLAQLEGQAGLALIYTFFLVCSPLVICAISFVKFKNIIQKIDYFYLTVCLFCLALIPVLNTVFISLLIICFVNFIAALPTIRKSWNDPYNEKALSFMIFVVSNSLGLLAIAEYNFLTSGYKVTILVVDTLIVSTLLIRRYQIRTRHPAT